MIEFLYSLYKRARARLNALLAADPEAPVQELEEYIPGQWIYSKHLRVLQEDIKLTRSER